MNKKPLNEQSELNEFTSQPLQNDDFTQNVNSSNFQPQAQENFKLQENLTSSVETKQNSLHNESFDTEQNTTIKALKKANKKNNKDADNNSLLTQKVNIELDVSKKVILVIATIFLALALIMFILSIRGCIALITNNVEGLAILGIAMAKIVIIGYFCFPGLLANIIAIIVSLFTIKATIPLQKKWSLSLIIISIIIFIVYLTLTILALTAK